MRFATCGLLAFGTLSTCALAANHTVVVGGSGLVFTPNNLTINAGDTVTFTNKPSDGGGGFHNVHSVSGPATDQFRCSVDCASNNNPDGSAWSDVVSFPAAGSVNYQCDQHANFGMTGTITVNTPVPVRLQSFEVD